MTDARHLTLEHLSQRVEQLTQELAQVRADIALLRDAAPSNLQTPRPSRDPHQGSTGTEQGPADVTANSDPQSKIALFMSRFLGRTDVYAQHWTSRKTGRSGWSPAVQNGFYTKDTSPADHLPLTPAVINEHLRTGGLHAGLYVMFPGDRCQLLACDFDEGTWRDDAAAYAAACRSHGLDPLTEISRSGDGAHVWLFFTEPIPASTARSLGFRMLRDAMASRPPMGLDSYDRFFPAQDTLSTRSAGKARLGNLIALPLNGDCRGRGTTVFVDPTSWEVLDDQFAALDRVQPSSLELIESLVDDLGVALGPQPERLRRPSRSELQAGRDEAGKKPITLEIDNSVRLPSRQLSGATIAELKHLSSLPNPEFYRRQAQRYSTFGTPRVVVRYEDDGEELRLPRGLLDDARDVLEHAGHPVDVSRSPVADTLIDVEFTGKLRGPQEAAVAAMAPHHTGIIVAPPGAGKTVVGCALIAHRNVPTAVVVNRAELVHQWRARLANFLDLEEEDIGQLGSGKRQLTGKIDVIMLQSINRKDSDPLILEDYGHIVVDECHNVAAPAAEGALAQVAAPFWLGLTATPFRSDKMDEIITMQCGPIRHRLDIDTANEERYLKVHNTDFTTEVVDPANIQEIYNQLAEDEGRNQLIVGQVAGAVVEGRRSLVLVNRLAALNSLRTLLTGKVDVPVLEMHGTQSKVQRSELREQLNELNAKEKPFVLVAMGRVVGEGLDLPSLNTLFLAAPISFKGLVIQQTGRITRHSGDEHASKTESIVHDFVDDSVPLLARMHARRLQAMKKQGFSLLD